MKREEKRQKFHEGLLRMLYPPPPSPPPLEENDEEPLHILGQGINFDQIPDEAEDDRGSSSSDDQASDHGPDQKLTRAKRKRLRRKKLKEAASHRQNIIGPLLPTAENDRNGENVSTTEEEPQGVRQNANEPGDADSCSKQNRLKQRRIAKRLVGGSSKSTSEGDKP
ncbi:PREDICTED: uncharacterized protein LOC109236196 [Nicotiana attenuata]|uniref:Uncharacterized protein n=1 Tax=Nicotiana attenuata TaxID=49451 RepID=A0A1J6IE79_NICAT|nr:PREDICTED: uncharacterized protein LOC109236196 [Nicotiana attenuata]OIS96078.1 hypothetical protein A4A49_03116 [Nicotiana attenuata]